MQHYGPSTARSGLNILINVGASRDRTHGQTALGNSFKVTLGSLLPRESQYGCRLSSLRSESSRHGQDVRWSVLTRTRSPIAVRFHDRRQRRNDLQRGWLRHKRGAMCRRLIKRQREMAHEELRLVLKERWTATSMAREREDLFARSEPKGH